MTGSLLDYDRLCEAHDAHLDAEAAFDREPCGANARLADQSYIAMVSAAARCDPSALRSPSISAWVANRVETYRRTISRVSPFHRSAAHYGPDLPHVEAARARHDGAA